LLTLFVALTALAIIIQAGVLVAIYLISKRLSENVERFMKETGEILVPIRSITENLKATSANLNEIGLSAREQFRNIESMVTDAGEALQVQLERFDRVTQNVAEKINETTEIVQDSIIRPVREMSAFAKGIGAFFFRRSRGDRSREEDDLFI
jgi:methyl-accepting chemotaxis protein